MPLYAPLAVVVEVRPSGRAVEGRVFRLSRMIAELNMILESPAPFEIGEPVTATFRLPQLAELAELAASAEALSLRAVVAITDGDGDGTKGGAALDFTDPPREARQEIVRYVAGRLGLPGGAARR